MAQPITHGKSLTRIGGFSYVMVLLLVMIIVLSMTSASEHIAITTQREKEAELLFIGQQYKNALRSYYLNTSAGARQLPMNLTDLLIDKRGLQAAHHLRQLYPDPMTPDGEWGILRTPEGFIKGIYSLSNTPVLTTKEDTSLSFSLEQSASNSGLRTYSDWKFTFTPEAPTGSQPMPGGLKNGESDQDSDEAEEEQPAGE